MLTQKEYKRRQDWFGTKIYWEICRKYGIQKKEKWYDQKPAMVMKNDKCKILWDFTVQTNHEIYGRRPDVMVVQDIIFLPENEFCLPFNGGVDTKELEKTEHC